MTERQQMAYLLRLTGTGVEHDARHRPLAADAIRQVMQRPIASGGARAAAREVAAQMGNLKDGRPACQGRNLSTGTPTAKKRRRTRAGAGEKPRFVVGDAIEFFWNVRTRVPVTHARACALFSCQ